MNSPLQGRSALSDRLPRSPTAPALPCGDGLDVLAIWRKVFDGVPSPGTECKSDGAAIHPDSPWPSRTDGPGESLSAKLPARSASGQESAVESPRSRSLRTGGDAEVETAPLRLPMQFRAHARSAAHAMGEAYARPVGQVEEDTAQISASARSSWPVAAPPISKRAAPSPPEFASRDAAQRETQDFSTTPGEESVLVLRDGHRIEIVVRNTALAAEAVVRCALEAAQQIAGHGRALRQVTLNGCTVYASIDVPQAVAADERSGPGPLLVFAC